MLVEGVQKRTGIVRIVTSGLRSYGCRVRCVGVGMCGLRIGRVLIRIGLSWLCVENIALWSLVMEVGCREVMCLYLLIRMLLIRLIRLSRLLNRYVWMWEYGLVGGNGL